MRKIFFKFHSPYMGIKGLDLGVGSTWSVSFSAAIHIRLETCRLCSNVSPCDTCYDPPTSGQGGKVCLSQLAALQTSLSR